MLKLKRSLRVPTGSTGLWGGGVNGPVLPSQGDKLSVFCWDRGDEITPPRAGGGGRSPPPGHMEAPQTRLPFPPARAVEKVAAPLVRGWAPVWGSLLERFSLSSDAP